MKMNRIFILFILIAISACESQAKDEQLSCKTVEILLQGNTYTTAEKDDVILSDDGSLIAEKWQNPKTVISTYFRVSNDGNLQLSMKYSANADSKININCSGKNFKVNCPKGNEKIVFIGNIGTVKAGYIRVDISGIKKAGTSFPNITSLLIEGSAGNDPVYCVNDSGFYYWGRRGPSVHMNYTLPQGNVEWFYNEVTVPEGYDAVGSYFMADGFGEGYFGMQVNSETERKILFSVWSPFVTDNPDEIPADEQILLNKKGDHVISQAFGGEGSGRQNIMSYMWKANTTYRFLVHCCPDTSKSGYTQYTAYFYSPENDSWMLVASNSRPKISTYYTKAHSFLENFDPETGYIKRKVYFGNQWAYVTGKGWEEITQSKFTCDVTGNKKQRLDFTGGVENNRFFLQNCGFFNDFTEKNTLFSKNTGGKAPEIDFKKLP